MTQTHARLDRPRHRYRSLAVGFVLGAALSFLALPIAWLAGSREMRSRRLNGVYLGIIVNAVIILPLVAMSNPGSGR